ncbi:MAG: hypothetical protein ACRDEA_22965, partial [Microcystaceae cyanobacterium]
LDWETSITLKLFAMSLTLPIFLVSLFLQIMDFGILDIIILADFTSSIMGISTTGQKFSYKILIEENLISVTKISFT